MSSQEPILYTVDLKKYFGEVRAVDGVSFKISPGEVVALIGPNGAGKTTFVNVITGYFNPDAGKIYYQGKDITKASRIKKIRMGIARSFQLVNLYDELTALDNVRIAVLSRLGKTSIFWKPVERFDDVRSEALEILASFGLEEKAEVPAKALPQGERKLLDVAVAFALRPRVLLLDEPTSGVSSKDKHTIMERIVPTVRNEKIATMIIEHDMDIVFGYSDRVVVMYDGKILAEGKPEEIRQSREVQEKLLGVTAGAS